MFVAGEDVCATLTQDLSSVELCVHSVQLCVECFRAEGQKEKPRDLRREAFFRAQRDY